MECDAWEPVEALAESLSAMADGDFHGAAGGDGWGSRLLESGVGAEEAVLQVSSVDSRDERLRGVGKAGVILA